MKRIIILILLLIFPLNVKAEVVSHYIDAEIEIAGALNVKELIIVKGNIDNLERTLNYKMIDKKWDNKTYGDLSLYNGYSLENIKIGVFETDGEVDFNNFSEDLEDYLEEYNIKEEKENYYTKTETDLGYKLNIKYDTLENDLTAFYIEYIITNIVVIHEDVAELNYSFLNLNYEAENTLIRVILPYNTEEKDFNVWIHGPSNGEYNYLTTESGNYSGIIASFPKLKTNVNIRLTIPKEQVGISMYLNKTKIEALDKIKKEEQAKIDKLNKGKLGLKTLKYIIVITSILYIPGSYILYKYKEKPLIITYLLLGIILTLFNILFKYNIIFLYFILVPPIIMLIKKS